MALLYATVAAAGSDQAGATELVNRYNTVTGADDAVGVRLSLPSPNAEVFVYSTAATAGLLVYPHVGGDINDGSQNAAITIEGKTLAHFVCLDGVTWGCIFTANT